VKLHFTSDALRIVAQKAIERKTGARGLRNVMEKIMLDIMYKLPSLEDVKECVINEAVIDNGAEPLYIFEASGQIAS
jgi:ATP-dependent Clp protease ATP-binding subunit ClpX